MKNLLTAFILGVVFAGVSLAQTSSRPQAEKVKVAVVEFSPERDFPGMTFEAKRQFQASLAFELADTKRFRVVDVRWTREASKENLAAINGDASTAAAVKLGKQLGVSYVLTGVVTEYTPKAADSYGCVVFKTRLIEVATGKVIHTVETNQRSTSAMLTDNAAELQSRAIKPAVEKLAATLAGLNL